MFIRQAPSRRRSHRGRRFVLLGFVGVLAALAATADRDSGWVAAVLPSPTPTATATPSAADAAATAVKLPLRLPPDPRLVGSSIYTQALTFAPSLATGALTNLVEIRPKK
ncbi:MAG: hypothetical protein ACE5EL_01730 [Anaerolineae bacterium]